MRLEFYIGVGKQDGEFSFKGYLRQKIVLEFKEDDSVGSNINVIVFSPSMSILGFADTFYLAGSEFGPVIAKSPMLSPIYVGAAMCVEIPEKTIVMSRASAQKIRDTKPILVS